MKKLAFGEREISKVLAHVKPMQLKSGPYQALGPKTVAAFRNKLKGIGGDLALNVHAGALRDISTQAAHGSRIQVPKRGDATSFFRSENPSLHLPKDPRSRRALDAIVKGHELAELQAKPSAFGDFHGHLSPDVILREHNMITTLPKPLASAGRALRDHRLPNEGLDMYQHTGLNFGKGERFSRHARKHLSKMMEEGTAAHTSRVYAAGTDVKKHQQILSERAALRDNLKKLGSVGMSQLMWITCMDELRKIATVDPSNTTLYADRVGAQQPKKPGDFPDMEGSDAPTSKLAWDGVGSTGSPLTSSTMARIDSDEKPDRAKKGDVPSRDGTSPGSAITVKHEAGPDFMTTVPTAAATADAGSQTGATTRM